MPNADLNQDLKGKLGEAFLKAYGEKKVNKLVKKLAPIKVNPGQYFPNEDEEGNPFFIKEIELSDFKVGEIVNYRGEECPIHKIMEDTKKLLIVVLMHGLQTLKSVSYLEVTKLQNRRVPKPIFDYNDAVQKAKSVVDNPFNVREDLTFTNLFYAHGVFNGSTFIEYNIFNGTSSISINQDFSEDLMVYIPVDFCELSGYNESFVQWYVNKLRELDIAVIEDLGISEMKGFEKFINPHPSQNILLNNKFYKFKITSDFSISKNLIHVMLSSLYRRKFQYIPAIMNKMEEERCELTTWQKFLAAMILTRNQHLFRMEVAQFGDDSIHLGIDIFSKRNDLDSIIKHHITNNCNLSRAFYYQQMDYSIYSTLNINNKKDLDVFIQKLKRMFL